MRLVHDLLLTVHVFFPPPAASLYGELEAVDAAVATGAAMEKLQERWPVLSLAEIKRMNRPTEEDGDDADGADAGLGFGLFDEEEGEEEEAEGGEEEACWLEYALEVQAPWSRRLLDGTKTIETRGYSLPTVVMDAPVLLIESPGDGGLAAHGLGAVSS